MKLISYFFCIRDLGWAGVAAFLILLPSFCVGAEENKDAFPADKFLLAPVRIHLLSAPDADSIETTLSVADMDRILKKINRIWAQGGIQFYRESVVREAALNQNLGPQVGQPGDLRLLLQLRPELSKNARMFHLYYIKRMSANGVYLGEAMFVKDTASLREVDGGIDEPLPRVSSHELGHALSLMHHTNSFHLMARGTTGFQLDADEIKQARTAAAQLDWIQTVPQMRAKIETLQTEGREKEAQNWQEKLDALPIR